MEKCLGEKIDNFRPKMSDGRCANRRLKRYRAETGVGIPSLRDVALEISATLGIGAFGLWPAPGPATAPPGACGFGPKDPLPTERFLRRSKRAVPRFCIKLPRGRLTACRQMFSSRIK
jgi:hypothetical protein